MLTMNQNAETLVKVSRPGLSGVYHRERLFRLLDRGCTRPMIWITGPPGCGKTTLVSSYIHSRKVPGLWYRIDETDSDVAQFFHYMSRAAQKLIRKKGSALPVYSQKDFKDITKFARLYFEELYSHFKKTSFVLVFDNYHELPEKSLLQKIINIGLLTIAKGGTIILISRKSMPPILSRIRANTSPEVLRWNELRLTQEEFEEIVQRKLGEHDREALQFLYTKTDGWVAGLVMMLEKVKTEKIKPQLLATLRPDEIFDYFKTEILEKIDPKKHDFLMKTAFFPRMTHHMAERFIGDPQAGRMLIDLHTSGCFTEKYLQSEAVYYYHPIFREFLLHCGRETIQEDDLMRLQRSAAEILEETCLYEDAAALFCKSCEWDKLIQLIYGNARLLIAKGRNMTLEGWLSCIPEEYFKTMPWLFYWKGLCTLPFNPKEGYRCFETAFEIFRSQNDDSGMFLAWAGAVEALIHSSMFTGLDEWIMILEDLKERFQVFPSREIEAQVASCMFIALVLRRPHHPEIDIWADRALSCSQECEDITVKIRSLVYLAWYKILKGDFAGASLAINSLQVITESNTVSPFYLLKFKEVESLYYWITGVADECQRVVSDGLALGRTTGIKEMNYNFLGHGAANALSTGDTASSKRLLQKMAASLEEGKSWDKSYYFFLKAWEAMLKRDMVQALINGETALNFAVEAGVTQVEALCHIEKAQVMHEMGEHEKAKESLNHARNIGYKIKSLLVEFMCLLSESQFAFDRGEEQTGLILLRNAMTIGKKQGYVNMFLWRAPVMAGLCAKALEGGIEIDYVQSLIKTRGLVHDFPQLHLESWPWPVKIFTLGRFSLVKDGKPVRSLGKVQKKPLSLLKALITLGGREVSEEHLLDILWYDADGDVAHKSFATTLHRLRRLIGNERVIQLHEGRLTLDTRYCWVDVWAFERMLGQVEVAWREGLDEHQKSYTIQKAEKAIELYKGPFLSGETDQPWTISYRERLRSKFLRTVRRLGLYWEEVGNCEKAVDCYQKGLEVDDLAEEFYQRLIYCYHSLDRRAEALTVYNRCRNTLSMVLGVNPSPSTETLYKKLLKGSGLKI
jgi:LuxR family maltose regulon positive regulatory protein